jgi:hypothetical protein
MMSFFLNKPKFDNFAGDYRCKPSTLADELLAQFWRLEKKAGALLRGLTQ